MHAPRALLHFARPGSGFLFESPLRVLAAERPGEVRSLLDEVEREAMAGRHAVGFVS